MKKLLLLTVCITIFAISAACAVNTGGSSSSSVNTESEWSDVNVDENGWT